ncbi:helix-turn-helix domain-containing protein [Adlercreutzia equolifaciens]|uniref:helix-turn-helix domain-containing protein n=1 Tax=Adlercreutzia equolifaciens TaxID=446660 RepID=UPI002672D9A1|nr:helix-turn-helix domain-containing protein [Adlercreutzia equolifaciens]
MGDVIYRGKGSFTFVENTIFFDHGLSAKAKGIYCQIRSLENNPEWVFTIKGFASLVRDGADAVSAGIRELESSGYIIRARKRSVNGRFLKAEEATWITLDDPAMHAQIAAELKADGHAILSEFTCEPPANVEFESSAATVAVADDVPEKGQVDTRTGKSVSGKATSGEPAPINNSSHKALEHDKEPLSCPPRREHREGEEAGRRFQGVSEGRAPGGLRATASRHGSGA